MVDVTKYPPAIPANSPEKMTSIAGRLFRIIFGCYFIVTLLVTCIQLIAEYRDTETRVTAEIKAMQQTFGHGIADAMWRYEDDVVRGILLGIKESSVVVGVLIEDVKGNLLHAVGMIQDNNGRNLLAYPDGHLSSVKESEPLFGKSFGQQFPIIFTDEKGRQQTIGKWTVYSNQSVIIKQVEYGFFLILVNSVIKTIALWFIFLFVVKRWLGTPLTQLTHFVQKLKLDNLGDRVFVLKDRSRHELHFLADTLNETLGKLHHSIAQNNKLYLDLQREKWVLRELNETLEQRIAERTQELLQTNEQLAALLDAIPDAVFFKDGEGRWLITNEPAKLLFQLHDIPWMGKTEMELAEIHPEFRAAHESCLVSDEMAWQAGELELSEERITGTDGRCAIFEARKMPLHGKNGQRKGLVIIGRDITESKQTEQSLVIAKESAELANQALKIALQQDSITRMKFLAKMSHEFRTPLNTVLGYAELLLRGSTRVMLQEGVVAIKNSSRHLLKMIDDILEHVRGESKQLTLRLAPVHWGNFIQSLEQSAVMMSDYGNRFQSTLAGDMPECVMVDELRLLTVLNNLLSNANRYTQNGHITFSCASAAEGNGYCRFTFTISDTGQGIAEEEHKRIFQPFVRGTAGKFSGIDGVGIGLVIAQQWVNLMGGEISVESKPGHGCRFFFSIVCELARVASSTGSVPENAIALGGSKILVVEDDENSRNLLAMLLVDAGFGVVTAKSGNDARLFLDGHAIKLVITDQFMPDGDGWSVLKDWSAQNIPLILLSAAPPDRPVDVPEKIQFACTQLKPVEVNSLLSAIGEILGVEWIAPQAISRDEQVDTIQRPSMELLEPLTAMIEQGAVTDIAEWLEIFSTQYPEYAPHAAKITTANLMLDFKELRRLIT